MPDFVGYFDDSGTHKGAGIVVVAGAVATAERWEQLSREWQRTIRPWRVLQFHATDFVTGKGEYRGWTEDTKSARLMALVKLIRKHVRVLIGNAVMEADFEEVSAKYPDNNFGTAYRFCAFLIPPAVDLWRRQSPKRGPVALIFESGNKLLNEYGRIVNQAGTFEHLRQKFGYSSITQGTSSDLVPLQAADLIAYATYRCAFMNKPLDSYLEPCFESLFKLPHRGQSFSKELIERALKELF